ncbi:Clp protease N-terminal domain-containing protein [Actinomadura welshii]
MFERFTKEARAAVTGAQAAARDLGDRRIGTGHLLLSVLRGDETLARDLREHGLDAGDLRARLARDGGGADLDAEALRSVGIDLDAVRAATEDAFGEGALDAPTGRFPRLGGRHIPFTPEAKKGLELSLRHAIRLKQKEIRSGHILLGILHDDGSAAARLAADAGADVRGLRAHLDRLLASEAA